jgi:glycosyltransferase involved in cell wall biosynthesis
MTLTLAVTSTEAFGYYPLESFMLGVPSIVGATTPSFRGAEGHAKRCIVNYIDDPAAISDAIMDVMDHYDEVLEDGMKMIRKMIT